MSKSYEKWHTLPVSEMKGEEERETALLHDMLIEARDYLAGFKWCPPIQGEFFGFGIGGVVAVFLFHLSQKVSRSDDWLWVIVGDLPSAYLVPDHAHSPAEALSVYCELMEDWATAVEKEENLNEVFPVKAHPTKENASALRNRIKFLQERIISSL